MSRQFLSPACQLGTFQFSFPIFNFRLDHMSQQFSTLAWHFVSWPQVQTSWLFFGNMTILEAICQSFNKQNFLVKQLKQVLIKLFLPAVLGTTSLANFCWILTLEERSELRWHQIKKWSEMEVARRYALLTLSSLLTLFSLPADTLTFFPISSILVQNQALQFKFINMSTIRNCRP